MSKKRNEIFGEQAMNAPAGIKQSDVVKDDFDWEVPVETVPIPSEGRVYDINSVLYNKTTLDINAMTAKEEDILTSRALIKKGTVITHLLQSCIAERGVSVQDMLTGDRNALMVAVRITGYGVDYNVEVTCPSCDEKSSQAFDLGELPLRRLSIDPVTPGSNMFAYTLPVTKKEVKFKFLTGKDEEEMSIIAERKKSALPGIRGESLVTSRLARSIVAIDEIEDKNKINLFVNKMPAQDSRKLRAYIDANEPGIDMISWMGCPHCGESSEVSLPLGASFFWPRD
jgi:hypothetical protein